MAESGAPFAHLHVHTEYSMLDGAARLKDLFAEVKNQGMTHVAMTDHGNMYGAAEFHRQAKDAGITPVIAFAPQTADAGPRITSICLISGVSIGRKSHATNPKKSW